MKKFGLFCFALTMLACNNDKFTDIPSASQFYSVLLTPEAASIAVGQTQQVSLVPRDANGNPLSVEGTPIFTSSDPTKVTVSATGLVTGIAVGTARVIGALQDIPGTLSSISVTRADTTIFTVSATPLAVGALTLSAPATGPKTTVGAGSSITLVTAVTDASGATIPSASAGGAQYYSSNPTAATVSSTGVVTGVTPGTTTITATITVGGVTKTSSYNVTVTAPTTGNINIQRAASGSTTIAFPNPLIVSATQAKLLAAPTAPSLANTGAIVNFTVSSLLFLDPANCVTVTFADPTKALTTATGGSSGNIPNYCSGTQSRLFTTPGTYAYTTTVAGAPGPSGSIVVQ